MWANYILWRLVSLVVVWEGGGKASMLLPLLVLQNLLAPLRLAVFLFPDASGSLCPVALVLVELAGAPPHEEE